MRIVGQSFGEEVHRAAKGRRAQRPRITGTTVDNDRADRGSRKIRDIMVRGTVRIAEGNTVIRLIEHSVAKTAQRVFGAPIGEAGTVDVAARHGRNDGEDR